MALASCIRANSRVSVLSKLDAASLPLRNPPANQPYLQGSNHFRYIEVLTRFLAHYQNRLQFVTNTPPRPTEDYGFTAIKAPAATTLVVGCPRYKGAADWRLQHRKFERVREWERLLAPMRG